MLFLLKNTFYILSIIFFTACSSSKDQTASEETASYDYNDASLDDKDRKLVKLVQYDMNQKPIITYNYEYNKDGKVIREKIIDSSSAAHVRESVKHHIYEDTLIKKTFMLTPDQDTAYVINMFYDDKNRLVKQESSDTTVYNRIEYVYDEDDNLVKQTTYERDMGTQWLDFTYTETDKMLEGKSYNINGQLVKWNKYLYNEDDEASDLFFFTPTGDTLHHFIYEYDDKGNKIAEKQLTDNGTLYIVKTFNYNEDNWLIMEEGSKYNIYKAIYIRDDRGKLEKIRYMNQYGNLERELIYR